MGDKASRQVLNKARPVRNAGCEFLSSSECLASPGMRFTSLKVSGYPFLEATPVPLLLAGSRVFLGLWLRKGCGCSWAKTLHRSVDPCPHHLSASPAPPRSAQLLSVSVGFSFKPPLKILSLSPKPSVSRYPKSPYLGTELLCDFIWCFMSLSLWKEDKEFFEWFRVKKEALNIVSHFFCFLLPPVILCLPSLNSPGLSLWAQRLSDLVQMMGSQRLKWYIMVSFMLYEATHSGVRHSAGISRVPHEKWGTGSCCDYWTRLGQHYPCRSDCSPRGWVLVTPFRYFSFFPASSFSDSSLPAWRKLLRLPLPCPGGWGDAQESECFAPYFIVTFIKTS